MVYKVIMCRHGESEWNQKNIFTGWYDTKLSKKGMEEAKAAGKAIKDACIRFDVAHTSVLTRAIITCQTILRESNQDCVPVRRTWRLNERHYGALTGLNKADTAAKYGEDQVKIWRRSYDIPPPAMDCSNKYFREIVYDPRYANDPPKNEMPLFESLELTVQRTLPYWNNVIVKDLKCGKTVLVAAHGNSLRGIVKHIDNISDDDITNLNLPTGIPFVYDLDCDFKPIVSMKFLGDPEVVKKAMAEVAAQGGKK